MECENESKTQLIWTKLDNKENTWWVAVTRIEEINNGNNKAEC